MPKKSRPQRPKSVLLPENLEFAEETEELTEEQRNFVTYHVHHKMSPTAAARQAGFSERSRSQVTFLMKHPAVQRAIAEERAAYARASEMTKRKVIDGFMEAIEMARSLGEPANMIAGWREIGKMCGLYEPQKKEIRLSVDGEIRMAQLEEMSDEELLKLTEQDFIEGELAE